MLSGFHINNDGSATGILTEFGVCSRADTLVEIPKETIEAFLESCGDGVASYRADFTNFVLANKV